MGDGAGVSILAEALTFPHDLDAERAVIGAILIDEQVIAAVADLRPWDFYRLQHQLAFRAARALVEKGQTVDVVTLGSELGDAVSAAELAAMTDGVPRSSNVVAYAEIIKRKASERRLAIAADRTAQALRCGDELTPALRQELQDALVDVGPRDRVSPLTDDVALLNRPAVPELIAGRLQGRGLGFLVGPPEVGKTFLLVDLGCAVALKTAVETSAARWLGAAVCRPGPVLYIAAEGGGLLAKRIAGWKLAHGVQLDQKLIDIWQGPVNPLDNIAVTRFIVEARQVKPVLVIADTWSRCTPGADENSGQHMGLAIANADRIVGALDCLFIAVHHTNAAETRERGHSSLRGAADTLLFLTKADEHITLTCDKQKDLEPFAPISLRLVPPYEGASTLIPRLAADVLPTSELTPTQQALLTVMRESFALTGCTHLDWQKASSGVKERSYYRARHELVRLGHVRQDGALFRLANPPLPTTAALLPLAETDRLP